MRIWVVTSEPDRYAFLELHHTVTFYSDYQKVSRWLQCADIANPDFIFFDWLVDKVKFFDFQKMDGVDEYLRLMNFIVLLPFDEVDVYRRIYSMGAKLVASPDYSPEFFRTFIEKEMIADESRDIPIKTCFKDMGLDFTPIEEKMLFVFSKMPQFKVKADTLRKVVWGERRIEKKNLDVHLSNLRAKILKKSHTITRVDSDYILQKIEFEDSRTQVRKPKFQSLDH